MNLKGVLEEHRYENFFQHGSTLWFSDYTCGHKAVHNVYHCTGKPEMNEMQEGRESVLLVEKITYRSQIYENNTKI